MRFSTRCDLLKCKTDRLYKKHVRDQDAGFGHSHNSLQKGFAKIQTCHERSTFLQKASTSYKLRGSKSKTCLQNQLENNVCRDLKVPLFVAEILTTIQFASVFYGFCLCHFCLIWLWLIVHRAVNTRGMKAEVYVSVSCLAWMQLAGSHSELHCSNIQPVWEATLCGLGESGQLSEQLGTCSSESWQSTSPTSRNIGFHRQHVFCVLFLAWVQKS